MNAFQNSFLLSHIVLIWDRICRVFGQSLCGAFFHKLGDLSRHSITSAILHYESRLDRMWRDSLFYRVVYAVLNFIPSLLYRPPERRSRLLSSSVFFRLLCALGENAPVLLGCMLAFLLVTPQPRWNNLYSLIIVFLILCLFYLAGTQKGTLRIDPAQVGFWPTLFMFISCLSLLWSQSFSLSLRFLFFAITCALTVLLCVSSVEREEQLYHIVLLCCLGLLVCSAYAFYQRVTGVKASSSYTDLSVNAKMPGRVFSFFENPNAFANLLVFFTPLMLSMTFRGGKPRHRILFFGCFLMCSVALLMTYSRGGWIALAVSLLVLLLFLCPRWVPLIFVLMLCTVPVWPASITNRILTIFSSDSSISSRSYIYTAAARLIRRYWLLGAGLGTTVLRRTAYYNDFFFGKFPFFHAHNLFLEVWAESGLFALIAFVGAVFFAVRDGSRSAMRPASPMVGGIAAGSVSGCIGAIIFGLTDYAWNYPRIMVLFWFLFAILCTAVKLSRATNATLNEKEG